MPDAFRVAPDKLAVPYSMTKDGTIYECIKTIGPDDPDYQAWAEEVDAAEPPA